MIENFEKVKTLITDFHYVPLDELSVVSAFRLFQLSRISMPLLDILVYQNGMDIKSVNDRIMLWVLSDTNDINKYLQRGFYFSDDLIISVLTEKGNAVVIKSLRKFVNHDRLKQLAGEAMMNMFSENGRFQPETATLLFESFNLPESVISKCILNTFQGFSKTRCYDQKHPEYAWQWIIKTYGSQHKLSRVAFSDSVVWVGDLAERSGNPRGGVPLPVFSLPIQFITEEFKTMAFEPYHIRYIAKAALCVHAFPHPTMCLQSISEWVYEQNQIEFSINNVSPNDRLGTFGLPLSRSKTGGILDSLFRRRGSSGFEPTKQPSRSSVDFLKVPSPIPSGHDRMTFVVGDESNEAFVLTPELRNEWITALHNVLENPDFYKSLVRIDASWWSLRHEQHEQAHQNLHAHHRIRSRSVDSGVVRFKVSDPPRKKKKKDATMEELEQAPMQFLKELDILMRLLRSGYHGSMQPTARRPSGLRKNLSKLKLWAMNRE